MTILCFIRTYPGLMSFLGSLLSAVISACVIIFVANHYTKRMKQIDATLEFNKRFQDLRMDQLKINTEYRNSERNRKSPGVKPESSPEAILWWRRYFDLMMFQFQFYCKGLVDESKFVQWMKWRQYDFNDTDQDSSATGGVTYHVGWGNWQTIPAIRGDPFVEFLNRVHSSRVDQVHKIVGEYAPRWWRIRQ
jgi:hypothetical protein